MKNFLKILAAVTASFAILMGCGGSEEQFQEFMAKGAAALESSSEADHRKAVKLFSKAILIKSENAKARYMRGVARTKLYDLHKAKEDFTRALELDPKMKDAYYQRALCSMALKIKDKELIKKDLLKVLELDPEHEKAPIMLKVLEKS